MPGSLLSSSAGWASLALLRPLLASLPRHLGPLSLGLLALLGPSAPEAGGLLGLLGGLQPPRLPWQPSPWTSSLYSVPPSSLPSPWASSLYSVPPALSLGLLAQLGSLGPALQPPQAPLSLGLLALLGSLGRSLQGGSGGADRVDRASECTRSDSLHVTGYHQNDNAPRTRVTSLPDKQNPKPPTRQLPVYQTSPLRPQQATGLSN